jgi:DNA-binding PadR family transcriptional regulator
MAEKKQEKVETKKLYKDTATGRSVLAENYEEALKLLSIAEEATDERTR